MYVHSFITNDAALLMITAQSDCKGYVLVLEFATFIDRLIIAKLTIINAVIKKST